MELNLSFFPLVAWHGFLEKDTQRGTREEVDFWTSGVIFLLVRQSFVLVCRSFRFCKKIFRFERKRVSVSVPVLRVPPTPPPPYPTPFFSKTINSHAKKDGKRAMRVRECVEDTTTSTANEEEEKSEGVPEKKQSRSYLLSSSFLFYFLQHSLSPYLLVIFALAIEEEGVKKQGKQCFAAWGWGRRGGHVLVDNLDNPRVAVCLAYLGVFSESYSRVHPMYLAWCMQKWVTAPHTSHIPYIFTRYGSWILCPRLCSERLEREKKGAKLIFSPSSFSILPIAVSLNQSRQEKKERKRW